MRKVYEFLKECGVFFVGTVDGEGKPQMRPFGAVMKYEGSLYISTARGKQVYKQMKENSFVQISALKPGTREWIRINAGAVEEEHMGIKRRMLEECPALRKHFSSEAAEAYAVFRLNEVQAEFY